MTQAVDARQSASGPPADAHASPAGPKVRLLLADDDDASRIAIGYILSNSGFDVEQAVNGQDALTKASNAAYDLAIMDLEMPVMDGLRALALLKRNPATKPMPVIMITRYASRENVRKCAELGASDFVIKQTLKIEMLIEKIAHVLGQRAEAAATGKPGEPDAAAAQTPIDQEVWLDKIKAIGVIEKESVKDAMSRVSLPLIFPAVRTEVRAALGGAAAIEEVVDLILQDAAMTAAVLDSTNQSRGQSPDQAGDVDAAVRRLSKAALGDVMAKTHADAGSIKPNVKPWLVNWWRHSICVSHLASELSVPLGIPPGLAKAAGLLHDVGRFQLLVSQFAPKLVAAYDLARNMIFPTAHAELALLGLNHKQVGQDYCAAHGLPESIRQVCQTHDLDDGLRDRLGERDKLLSAVVCAADQIAKAAGLGSLPNDEIIPLPALMIHEVDHMQLQIDRAIAQVQTLCLWRTGQSGGASLPEGTNLSGRMVILVSPGGGPWNPLRRVLSRAGAVVTSFTSLKEVLDHPPASDLLVLDYCGASLDTAMPLLRRLTAMDCFKQTPKLLLARRSEEPESRISDAELPISVYPTPIRILSLLQATRRLVS